MVLGSNLTSASFGMIWLFNWNFGPDRSIAVLREGSLGTVTTVGFATTSTGSILVMIRSWTLSSLSLEYSRCNELESFNSNRGGELPPLLADAGVTGGAPTAVPTGTGTGTDPDDPALLSEDIEPLAALGLKPPKPMFKANWSIVWRGGATILDWLAVEASDDADGAEANVVVSAAKTKEKHFSHRSVPPGQRVRLHQFEINENDPQM